MKEKLIELKELKDYYIDNDIVEIHKTISFKRFYILMTILLGINYGIKLNRYTDVYDLC